MKRFLTLLLCLTLLVSMAALPATSLAEETVELTFYYPVGVGGDPALLIENLRRNLPRKIPTSSLTRFSAGTPLKPPPRPSRPFRAAMHLTLPFWEIRSCIPCSPWMPSFPWMI